jgi:integrase/recombinase XerC
LAGQGPANAWGLAWRNEMAGRGLTPATIARRLAALRSVVKLARTIGRVSWGLDVAAPKAERYRDTRGPGEDGWKVLREFARDRAAEGTAEGARNLALVRLLHDLGLRRGEVASPNLGDVDIDEGFVMVVGKGRTDPIRITLPEPVMPDLAAWMKFRAGAAHGDPVFVRCDRAAGEEAGRLTGDGIAYIVKRLGERSGVKHPVRPHGQRHAGITPVRDRSQGNIRAAARFSRHRDLRTLTIYDDALEDITGRTAGLISDE